MRYVNKKVSSYYQKVYDIPLDINRQFPLLKLN